MNFTPTTAKFNLGRDQLQVGKNHALTWNKSLSYETSVSDRESSPHPCSLDTATLDPVVHEDSGAGTTIFGRFELKVWTAF